MERNLKSTTESRETGRRASPMLAFVIPAAIAGLAFASYDAAAAPKDLQASVAKAQDALQKGQPDKAIVHAEAAVTADPLNPDYRAMLGAAYMGAGRFTAAATSFGDALDLGLNDSRTVLSYALAKTAVGDARVAVAALDEARNGLNAADYGLALALAGQADRGVQVLIHAVRTEEATPKLRQNLAYAYALSGNWRAARVMASEDLPAGQVDTRMVEWAETAAPEQFQERIARLLKVRPVFDAGQPGQLALVNFRNAPAMLATPAPKMAATPEAVRPVEPPATSFAAAAPAQQPIERFEPSPARIAAATPTPAPAPVAAPAAQRGTASGIRFVSNPVVQALPGRTNRAVAPAPQQRRMAATTAASAPVSQAARTAPAPAPAQVAAKAVSDKQLDSHLVQLGSYSSKVEAERGWNAIKAKFPLLKDHDVVITEAVVNGRTFFRVAAAGFGPQSAKSLCGTLKSAGRGCFAYAATNPPAGAVDKGVRLAARTR